MGLVGCFSSHFAIFSPRARIDYSLGQERCSTTRIGISGIQSINEHCVCPHNQESYVVRRDLNVPLRDETEHLLGKEDLHVLLP